MHGGVHYDSGILRGGGSIFDSPEIKTKLKILHAVDKSLDRITISEICENADISRQTFYRHFKSKYDIPSWHTMFCRHVIIETLTKWRHVNIDHNMRFLVETFSKLECEILNDWLRSERETDLTQWTNDLLSIVPVKLYKAMLIPPSDKKTKS